MADTFNPINICVYCGKTSEQTKLKDEHIIPYSLNGTSILPKASCGDCEKITSAFEGRVVSKMYPLFRLLENVKTRRPKKRESGAIINGVSPSGEQTQQFMPTAGLIGTYPIVHFQAPGFLRTPIEVPRGWIGAELSVLTRKPSDQGLWNTLASPTMGVKQNFDLESYALLLAKIGHCCAVGNFGVNNFDHWLTPFILGQKKKGLHYLIGGASQIEPPVRVQHEIKYEIFPYSGSGNLRYYISISIRLFAHIGGPHAVVIAGATDEDRFQSIKNRLAK